MIDLTVHGVRCQDARQADILRRIFAGDLDASPARRLFAAGPEPAPAPPPAAPRETIRPAAAVDSDALAYACRVARRDRRRRLAAWLAGEGAIPPHVEALIERKAATR